MLKWWLICLSAVVFFLVALSLFPGEARRVDVSVIADIPREEAWVVLQDFSVAHNYVPGLTGTEIVSVQQNGPGAHRKVYQSGGGFLEETIVEWREGEGFMIKLHNGPEPMTPFTRAEFIYKLGAQEPEKTLIELTMIFKMPLGLLGATLGEWFIEPIVEKNLILSAAGMKHYYQTGTPATDNDRERLAGYVHLN